MNPYALEASGGHSQTCADWLAELRTKLRYLSRLFTRLLSVFVAFGENTLHNSSAIISAFDWAAVALMVASIACVLWPQKPRQS